MSILKQNLNGAKETVNYNPDAGFAEAQLVAIADLGVETNAEGKEYPKIGLLFAVDQKFTVGGTEYYKTHPEKMTASLYCEGNLFKKIISPAGWEVPEDGQILGLLGKQLNLFFKARDEYMNIIGDMVEPTSKPFALPDDAEIWIPKFWKEKNGVPTGFEIITIRDGVL